MKTLTNIRWAMICTGIMFVLSGFSQFLIQDTNFELIPQKCVRKYIKNQQLHNIKSFADLQASCYNIDTSEYFIHQVNYHINDNVKNVWNVYKNTNPVKAWNGRIISFGIMYSRKADKVIYYYDTLSCLEEGQIIYFDLKFLKGMYNLVAVIEVIDIDEIRKIIKFSYIEGGKNRGMQVIQFLPEHDGFTHIIHTTAYQSDSKFRDKYLYCYFHKKSINELHKNMFRSLKK